MRALLLAFLLAGGAPAGAQTLPGTTPETAEAARELVQSLHVDHQLTTILGGVRSQLVAALQRSGKSEADAGTIVDRVLMPEFRSHAGELADAIGAIWASQLSVDDMHALRDVYQTPVGKKLLAVQPAVFAESTAAGRVWGERVAREALAKHAAELRRRGVGL